VGIWGWDEIEDGVTLKGFVADSPFVASDADWNFNVIPARGFRHLLANPSDNRNGSGLIECEIEPPQHLKNLGLDVRSNSVADQLLGSPKGKWVTVTGTWSVDRSHTVAGETADFGGSSALGKTEIHPITSVLVEHPPAKDNSSRAIEFLVFSDDSDDFPAKVPHSHEIRVGSFSVPIPPGTNFTMVSELNQANSKTVSAEDTARFRTETFQVVSGRPEDKQGFYRANIKLPGFTLLTFLLSRGSDPTKGIREMMHRAQTTSLRALFQRLDAAALAPLPCASLLGQMAGLQGQIASLAQQLKALQKDGVKPKHDPAFKDLQNEMQDLLHKLGALGTQANTLGCFDDS